MNFGVCFVVCLFGRRGVVFSSVISEKKIAMLFKINVYLCVCLEGILGVFLSIDICFTCFGCKNNLLCSCFDM